MENNFSTCLKFVLAEEGQNSDDKRDAGGRTSRGVTQKVYWADQDLRGVKRSDVWKASTVEIRNIYYKYYWQPWCPKLPSGLDLCYFDMCVNAGNSQAIKTLQRALSNIPVDGVLGARTLALVDKQDKLALIDRYCEQRANFYKQLKQFPIYGKGWLARVNRCKNTAIRLLSGDKKANIGTELTKAPVDTVSAKAPPSEMAEPIVSPEQAGGGAAGFGSASGIVNQIQEQLVPYQYTLRIVEYALLALAAISIGFLIYGIIRRKKIQAVT